MRRSRNRSFRRRCAIALYGITLDHLIFEYPAHSLDVDGDAWRQAPQLTSDNAQDRFAEDDCRDGEAAECFLLVPVLGELRPLPSLARQKEKLFGVGG